MRDLLELVLRGKFTVFPNYCRRERDELVELAQTAVAIDAQNVHVWQREEWRRKQNSWRDRLSQLPPRMPFPVLWVEWEEQGVNESGNDATVPLGLLIEETEGYNRPAKNGHRQLLYKPVTAHNDDDDAPDFFGQIITVFSKDNNTPLFVSAVIENSADRRTFWRSLPEDRLDGKSVRLEEISERYEIPDKWEAKHFPEWAAVRSLETYLPMLIFMNCHNVTLNRIAKPARAQRKFEKRYHVRRPSFHVIEVHKTMVRNVYEQGIANETVMHAHMVRGHVKHYGEHNKLFGRIAGSWFWQSHVRGDIGTPTVSDYRVWGADEEHESECDILQ